MKLSAYLGNRLQNNNNNKKVSGDLKAFGAFKFAFLHNTGVSSSPQCSSRCHPNRSFQRNVRFPVAAYAFQ